MCNRSILHSQSETIATFLFYLSTPGITKTVCVNILTSHLAADLPYKIFAFSTSRALVWFFLSSRWGNLLQVCILLGCFWLLNSLCKFNCSNPNLVRKFYALRKNTYVTAVSYLSLNSIQSEFNLLGFHEQHNCVFGNNDGWRFC